MKAPVGQVAPSRHRPVTIPSVLFASNIALAILSVPICVGLAFATDQTSSLGAERIVGDTIVGELATHGLIFVLVIGVGLTCVRRLTMRRTMAALLAVSAALHLVAIFLVNAQTG